MYSASANMGRYFDIGRMITDGYTGVTGGEESRNDRDRLGATASVFDGTLAPWLRAWPRAWP